MTFQLQFGGHHNAQSVPFLKMCLPDEYAKRIELEYDLQTCLRKLSSFTQDSKIYTLGVDQEIRALPRSISNETDVVLIQDQISLYCHCLDIDPNYFLARAEIGLLTCKYFCPALRSMTDQFIDRIACGCNDVAGKRNYIFAFLETAKINLKYV